MRQDIYNYLHEIGWSFDHITEDGRRIWNRQVRLPGVRAVITRFDEEERLVEMAMEAKGA